MCKFDMITCAPPEILDQGDDINNKYFTIDTADMITVHEWIAFNPYIVTHAMHHNDLIGFFNVIPITKECATLFDQHRLKEEDLSIEHMLAHEVMQHAEYAYLAGIAIKDINSFKSKQCAAALMSVMADHFLNGYNSKKFKRIYANPTTFHGNHLVKKLGLKPVGNYKKSLTENDIYAIDITPETIAGLTHFSQRYSRFVGSNPWTKRK